METESPIMRVLFHDGGWVDVRADFYRDDGDGWVTLRKGATDKQAESEIVAFFPDHLVLGVVQPDMIVDRNIIPPSAPSIIKVNDMSDDEMRALIQVVLDAAQSEPIDFTKPCWPDGPIEKV